MLLLRQLQFSRRRKTATGTWKRTLAVRVAMWMPLGMTSAVMRFSIATMSAKGTTRLVTHPKMLLWKHKWFSDMYSLP